MIRRNPPYCVWSHARATCVRELVTDTNYCKSLKCLTLTIASMTQLKQLTIKSVCVNGDSWFKVIQICSWYRLMKQKATEIQWGAYFTDLMLRIYVVNTAFILWLVWKLKSIFRLHITFMLRIFYAMNFLNTHATETWYLLQIFHNNQQIQGHKQHLHSIYFSYEVCQIKLRYLSTIRQIRLFRNSTHCA